MWHWSLSAVSVMVGSHVRLQTCDHFNIYLSNVGALTDISERTLDREKEGEATGWETDGETETEWLWHWSLSLWWGTGQQRGVTSGCQRENWSEEAFSPSPVALCSCQVSTAEFNLRPCKPPTANAHQVESMLKLHFAGFKSIKGQKCKDV